MLEPQRMDKVLIVGTKDVMEATINALHDLDLLHIEDYTEEGAYFHIGKPLKSATPLSEKLLKLRSIRSHLKTKDDLYKKEGRRKVLEDINKELLPLEKSLTDRMSEKSALESEIKELARREEALKPFAALGVPLDLLYGYESVTALVGTMPKDVEPIVSPIARDYELFSAPYGKDRIIALYVPNDVAPQVSDAMMKADFIEIEPPKEAGDPAELVKKLAATAGELKKKLETVEADVKSLNEKYGRFILASEELLTIDTQKAEAPLRFATSDNVFAVDGWVPSNEFGKLKAALSKATDDRVYMEKVEPEPRKDKDEVEPHVTEHHEVDAPVKYNNPKWMFPLQSFVDLYSRPKYNEVDPTEIFFFTFPLFYGFILGDIGYGLLLLAIGLFLRHLLRRSAGWQILTNALIICSISAVFFGFVFGEFMGFNMVKEGFMGISFAGLYPHNIYIGSLGPYALPLERLFAGGPEHGVYVFGIKDLLVLTCLIGVAQMVLGYVIGFRNEYVKHGLKTAILHKLSWIFLLLGGVAMVWVVFPLMITQSIGLFNPADPLFLVGAGGFLIGLVMVIMGEGMIGILEIPTLMSNVLSYTRLLAVGLSSVGIAFAVNTMVHMMVGAGIIGLIGGVIVFLLGHTVNLALGVIAPGLHALRLHYVEFFRKFYQGGGKIYDPFGYLRKYTEET